MASIRELVGRLVVNAETRQLRQADEQMNETKRRMQGLDRQSWASFLSELWVDVPMIYRAAYSKAEGCWQALTFRIRA